MPQYSGNKYLQSLLENLISSYETEINYNPLEIELDSKQLTQKEDFASIRKFLADNRKRLFIFKIEDNPEESNRLAFLARRHVLNKSAENILKNTSNEPKINPIKYALSSNAPAVRARIQIQKSIRLPKPPIIQKDIHHEQNEQLRLDNLTLLPIDLPDLPQLVEQLKALDIHHLQDAAIPIIKEHSYAFRDGIIPGNLPKGFYIDKEKKALCYTDTPKRLPSALAPTLKTRNDLPLPSIEQATTLLPHLSKDSLSFLLESHYAINQKNILLGLLSTHEGEIKNLLLQLSRTAGVDGALEQYEAFIYPFLCKQYVMGGESHTILLVRLLHACSNKKIDLEFLKYPEVQNSLLSTRGIKNLQKLIQLPGEQKEWWNKLVLEHLQYDKNSFDFNVFFEAYTQIFLPRIAEKNLTLPNPCPIQHQGHFLITLNRVLDVIEHAKNPQEQGLSLSGLNWGPTGVHFAMMQAPISAQFQQVDSCMEMSKPEHTITDPELIYQKLDQDDLVLKPWLFRFMGQHWKSEIRLSHIKDQLLEIDKLVSWSAAQKNKLTYILACTFADKATLTPIEWKETLTSCIQLLQDLDENSRNDLLGAFSQCFKFKPLPSLIQIKELMKLCIEFRTEFPEKNWKDEFIAPLISCLENEGFELFNILQERIEKTDPNAPENREGAIQEAQDAVESQLSISVIANFTTILHQNRHVLNPDLIQILAKINEPHLSQEHIDELIEAVQKIQSPPDNVFEHLVLNTLSQINLSKSKTLPKIEQIIELLNSLAEIKNTIPVECNTHEKRKTWLEAIILSKNPFPGCILGNGDISNLDGLIVDALADAIKKRSAVFDIKFLKEALKAQLNHFLVPQQLREQLDQELMPLFDAVDDLIQELQDPNPSFSKVIEKLKYFEKRKPVLLEATYRIIGETKGEYILSFLLTGKRKDSDQTTKTALAAILGPVHNLLVSSMKSFFNNPEKKQIVKDLDLNTCLSWMASFNETHSLIFFFKEELIQKKVIPALKKTLQQLNIQDLEFEKSILEEAAIIDENTPSDQALQSYKNKIESIANYLSLLGEINDQLPQQFTKIYKQLNTGALARLNYKQKYILVNQFKDNSEKLDLYFKLITKALEENPYADTAAIERAVNGLVDVFRIPDLQPDTQILFCKMSLAHNLKSINPFPIAALNEFKKSDLPEITKSFFIKQIIQILGLPKTNSELIQTLIQQTILFLNQNQEQSDLCLSLLRRISHDNPNNDLKAYPQILQELNGFDLEIRTKIATILSGLATNKKDTTVNLPALLDVAKGLKKCLPEDIEQILKLFTSTPYPNTQGLNTALLAPDLDKLHQYCLEFDTNPCAKNNEKRDLAKHFATDRIKEALVNLQDLLQEEFLPHALQQKLARQLTFIETLGYTDPLNPEDPKNPEDFKKLHKLTQCSRHDLKARATTLLQQFRSKTIPPEQMEVSNLELLAYLREIYFRTTGLFPNTTQMLILLLALQDPSLNLLMRIKTGEGKSINTPMLSVLQWAQGGTVVQLTANPTLLGRDYENSCEPFFSFLDIESSLIQSDTPTEQFIPNGINCSTIEDMASFHSAAKITKKEHLLKTIGPVHIVLDECHNALLDQLTLYKLVSEAEEDQANNPAQWIYPLAYQFIQQEGFRNTNPAVSKVWDEDEDLDEFRLFLNKQINEQYNGDVEKQNYLMAVSNTQLKQWIHASGVAATLKENKHFILQPVKEKDESGQEFTKKIACIPLIRSTPKGGSVFTEEVQQALQARLKMERKEQAQYIVIDPIPSVLASQSAQGLIKFFLQTLGRLLGISATPGSKEELESLDTSLGIQAISIAPHAGDIRINHDPIFTYDREGTITAIHKTFNKIKLPVTKPQLTINPDEEIQTYTEREQLLKERKQAIDAWSITQTQPILIINEDFDEAQAIGDSLKVYEEQGFKIQILTGKESPAELEKLIKQAGQANTITVGTAMLAEGIDINPGDHPRGLFVMQTYPDTLQKTIQIGGRAARNGKPGEWLPIYQVKPPQDLFNKFLYYVFPWTRQSINEKSIEVLREKIQIQATVDRIYTQSIDEVEQSLMRQIEAWEELLLELFHDDPKIQFELFQWREMLLSELARSQDAGISQSTLYESIEQFKKLSCKLWESVREEKWAAKADKAAHMSQEQSIRLKYLKQLDFGQEINIQTKLQQKGKPFTAGINALMHQNLETIIADKAGAVLEYTQPSVEEKSNLELAQCKQLLPHLIGNFCSINPDTIKIFFPKASKKSSLVPEIISNAIDKLIERKNMIWKSKEKQEVAESIIHIYKQKLRNAANKDIQDLLIQMKPLILNCSDLSKISLVEQFKMQGLILTYANLYRNSGLEEDPALNNLQKDFDEDIMKKLGQYLIHEFAWASQQTFSFHAFFERTSAKNAASEIYTLALDLVQSPQDPDKIQKLYFALEQHQLNLKDKYLFSMTHSSPRKVIYNALSAIEALNQVPQCTLDFRQKCHDKVVSEHHVIAFRKLLMGTSPYFFKRYDPVWDHMANTLLEISQQSQHNPVHIVQELYEAVQRFSTYEAYQPYIKQLNALKKQLLNSTEILKQSDGLHQDVQASLLAEKQIQIARLLKIDPKQLRIQSGSDGIQSFIDMQVEDAPLQEEFTGYQSAFLTRVEAERAEFRKVKQELEEHKEALLHLSDRRAMEYIPASYRVAFDKLFRLKGLLALDWNNVLFDRTDLPDSIKGKMVYIDEINHWDWKLNPVDQPRLKEILGIEPREISDLLKVQSAIMSDLSVIRRKLQEIESEISKQDSNKKAVEQLINSAKKRMDEKECTYWEKVKLGGKNLFREQEVQSFQSELNELQRTLNSIQEEEKEYLQKLQDHNDKLDKQRKPLVSTFLQQIKDELAAYLNVEVHRQVDAIEKELQETDPVIERIEKAEIQKTRYQTRRFFKTSELLDFEARLAKETARIPQKEGQLDAATELDEMNRAILV